MADHRKTATHDFCKRFGQNWRSVQRFRAPQAHALFRGEFVEKDIDVVEHFHVLAGETDRIRVLKIIRQYLKPDQRVFVGVVAPIDERVETPEEIRDRVLEAAEYIPIEQLGTTDDCGFSPFCDDTTTTRDKAFEKIRARVAGTQLAAALIGGS